MTPSYSIPAKPVRTEIIIKKSRFLMTSVRQLAGDQLTQFPYLAM